MTNAVAVLVFETEVPIPMTCDEAVAIPKGTCVELEDPFTISASNGANDLFGGIAAEEKIAGDGKATIAVYRGGIFKVEAGTSGVSVGKPVKLEAANEFRDTTANDSDLGYNWGMALETATNGEFFLIDLGRNN